MAIIFLAAPLAHAEVACLKPQDVQPQQLRRYNLPEEICIERVDLVFDATSNKGTIGLASDLVSGQFMAERIVDGTSEGEITYRVRSSSPILVRQLADGDCSLLSIVAYDYNVASTADGKSLWSDSVVANVAETNDSCHVESQPVVSIRYTE